MIIIMRFSENNILGQKYIDIYQFQGLVGGRYIVHLIFLFIIHKDEKKVQEHDLY